MIPPKSPSLRSVYFSGDPPYFIEDPLYAERIEGKKCDIKADRNRPMHENSPKLFREIKLYVTQ